MVLFLLAFSLATYSTHARGSFEPGSARRLVVWLASPVQNALVGTVDFVGDSWKGYVSLRLAREENLVLRDEVARLKEESHRLAEAEAELARMRRLVSYVDAQPEMRLVAAPVIAFGADTRFRGLRIARGADHGMRPGMAVVTPDGVVGRLLHVYDHASDVQLIVDPQSAVAAQSQRTRARATARGLGRLHRLRLDYLVRTDDLEEGDLLVTAPSGGIFPRGLRIGRAANVTQSAQGLFKSAEVIPAVDFTRLEEVLVVVDNAPSAARELPAAALTR